MFIVLIGFGRGTSIFLHSSCSGRTSIFNTRTRHYRGNVSGTILDIVLDLVSVCRRLRVSWRLVQSGSLGTSFRSHSNRELCLSVKLTLSKCNGDLTTTRTEREREESTRSSLGTLIAPIRNLTQHLVRQCDELSTFLTLTFRVYSFENLGKL